MFLVDERFTAKVAFTEDVWDCWEWTGTRTGGYGRLGRAKRGWAAHVLVFEWWHERRVGEGLEVMHLCHNPPCVNPCHLKEGTHKENMLQMVALGRGIAGYERDAAYQAKHREGTPRGDRHWTRSQPEKLKRGEANGNSKLTQAKVDEIRRLRREGATTIDIAKQFDISSPLVSYICLGRIWR